MKILKYIMFLSILSGLFLVIYRQSEKKGFRRWWISFRMAAFIAAILAGLIPDQVQAVPLPGVDGFAPTPVYIYRCRKRETYSRQATALSTRLKENLNNQNIPRENKRIHDRRLPESGSILEDLQVRRKFKDAPDFGVIDNPNRENVELFKDKITEHMKDPSTIIKEGTYKKNIEVVHYFNEKTGLNVMIRQSDKTFVSGWKLNPQQQQNVKDRGAL